MIKEINNQIQLECTCGVVHVLEKKLIQSISGRISAKDGRWKNATEKELAENAQRMVQARLKKALKKNSKKRKSIVK